ncbi:MAG: endo-1,4-beta-xylanase [Microgenomates group bacterium]|jgi:hypothetical protein
MIFRHIARKYQEIEHLKMYVLLGLSFLVIILYSSTKIWDQIHYDTFTIFGVTYSPTYAATLGLDPRETYQQMFKDLKVRKIRLAANWDEVERTQDQFDFSDLDYYVGEARKHNAQIILSIGYKLPRWPECRVPKYLEHAGMQYRQERQLIYIKKVIEHYENNYSIVSWQIENEPLLEFGTCDPVDEQYLRKEIAYVRSITSKPIIITDSGELSSWITPMQLSDIFGTTMYRSVINPILGEIPYYFQPWYYRVKSETIRKFLAPNNKEMIVVELQAEPWAEVFIADMPVEKQLDHFTVQSFKNNVTFAKKVGTSEIYLWGVEWWYWIAKLGHPEFLEYAKTIFK